MTNTGYNGSMDKSIIERLTAITAEEERIREGNASISRADYAASEEFIISEQKMLGERKQIGRAHV